MSDYLPELPIGTVVVEVRSYVKQEPDTWVRQHTGEEIRSGWIHGLFADGIATAVKPRTRRMSTELTAAKCEELGHEVIEACFRCGREAHEIYGESREERSRRLDDGWVPFGWHAAYPDVQLEFDGGTEWQPEWERNRAWAAWGSGPLHHPACDQPKEGK